MKRIFKFLTVSFVISIICLIFGSCSTSYLEITSIDDLYAMESKKSYILTCDLDLEERQWYPLEVKNFDGNGYTISNFYLMETGNTPDSYLGFLSEAESIKNITFESVIANFTYSTTDTVDGGVGIVCGKASELENLIIRNCTLSFLQNFISTGAFIEGHKGSANVGILSGYAGEIKKCQVEDCEIYCSATKYFPMDIGGLTGQCDRAENCKISNTNVDVVSDYNSNIGMLGGSSSDVTNCLANNNKITANLRSEYTSRAGGLIGKASGVIERCISRNNRIELTTEWGYNVGGLIGKNIGQTINCLSDSNYLKCMTSKDSSKQYAGVGGLLGSNNNKISQCVVQNCEIIGTSYTASSSMYAAGFVSEAEAAVIDCIVYDTNVSGGNRDMFTAENELLQNCYIGGSGQSSPNINSLPKLSNKEWWNILTLLSLDSKIWYLDNFGKLDLIIE